VSSGETKNRGSASENRGPGLILGLAALSRREPQTPSSALRGRPGMDIMELRRHEALREFSRGTKWWRSLAAKHKGFAANRASCSVASAVNCLLVSKGHDGVEAGRPGWRARHRR